jgi:antitoxin component of MazEF toxin-antitoxin module
MVQKVIKYGNSMAVILPKESTASAGIRVGSLVTTSVEGGRVIVQPVDVVPKLSTENQQFVDRLYAKRRKVFDELAK